MPGNASINWSDLYRSVMARFIVSHLFSGKKDKAAVRDDFEKTASGLRSFASVVSDKQYESPDIRRVLHVEAEPREIQQRLSEWGPGVLAEPEAQRFPAVSYPGFVELERMAQGPTPVPAGVGASFSVTLGGSGQALEGASLTLFLANLTGKAAGTNMTGNSNAEGKAQFLFNPALWQPSLLLIEPRNGYWGWLQAIPQDGGVIDLPPLPKKGPLGWWQNVLGEFSGASSGEGIKRGEGIKIGIADTGVGPHPFLSHVYSLGSVIAGDYNPAAGSGHDVVGHGSHVCGIVAARPVDGSEDYRGIAPGADVAMVRIFPPNGGGANQGDIAQAIDILSSQFGADLINLSLGSPQPSGIEQDAVRAAADMGTLCMAAAGNGFAQPVLYPAAYSEVAAVGALGLFGSAPLNSLAAYCTPQQPGLFGPGGLFVANFSNSGAELACAAPGVGIISTVPATSAVAAPYAERSGTSMASPAACAALATLLSHDETYKQTPRTIARAQRASLVLMSYLAPLGMSQSSAGWGLSQAWPG
jgi:hypothetical protein